MGRAELSLNMRDQQRRSKGTRDLLPTTLCTVTFLCFAQRGAEARVEGVCTPGKQDSSREGMYSMEILAQVPPPAGWNG